jgi:hypothetical protein
MVLAALCRVRGTSFELNGAVRTLAERACSTDEASGASANGIVSILWVLILVRLAYLRVEGDDVLVVADAELDAEQVLAEQEQVIRRRRQPREGLPGGQRPTGELLEELDNTR